MDKTPQFFIDKTPQFSIGQNATILKGQNATILNVRVRTPLFVQNAMVFLWTKPTVLNEQSATVPKG